MSEKTSPCMTGDQISSETILMAHFSAGGCVQVAGKEYWYRMPTAQLEMLCATSDEWVESFRLLHELVRTEKIIACDVPTLARQIEEAEGCERERRAESKPCIAPNGYRFPIGEELRLHLNEGGHVMINGRETSKWYRMRANLLECLYENSAQWVASAWKVEDLAEMERVVACSEPELSKEIRMRDQVIADAGCARPRICRDAPKDPQEQPAQNLWQPISFAEAMHAITLGATVTRIGELPVHIYASINGEHVVRRVARGGWARVILNVDMIQAKWKVINQFDKDYLDSSISAEWDGK